MSTWTNDDGLLVRFGLSNADIQREGLSNVRGVNNEIVAEIVAEDLPAVGTSDFINHGEPSVAIPAGAVIVKATLIVSEAFAGATATLNIGTAKKDGTAIDADGIDAAIAVTDLSAGTVIECDGAQIGSIPSTTDNAFLTVQNGTADFTAGKARLVLEYMLPVE